jgi:hypothetical protein
MAYLDIILDFESADSESIITDLDVFLENGILNYHVNKNKIRLYASLHDRSDFWSCIDQDNTVKFTIGDTTFQAKAYRNISDAPLFTFPY